MRRAVAGPRRREAGEGRGPEAIGPECPRPGASRKRRLALRPVDIEAGLRGSRLRARRVAAYVRLRSLPLAPPALP